MVDRRPDSTVFCTYSCFNLRVANIAAHGFPGSVHFRRFRKDCRFNNAALGLGAIYVFFLQQRAAYVQQLRSVCESAIKAVEGAVYYTHRQKFTEDQWLQVVHELSASVESIRTVYENLRENDRRRGFYPYEGIKHILQLMLRLVYPGQYIGPQPDLAQTRKEITETWKRTREQLFRELPRGSAHYHDSPFI